MILYDGYDKSDGYECSDLITGKGRRSQIKRRLIFLAMEVVRGVGICRVLVATPLLTYL